MQARRHGFVEFLTHDFLAWVAVAIFAVLVCLFVAGLFLYAAKPAKAAELYRVPSVCRPLADRYGVPETVSREQAIQLMSRLDLYAWWPGVKQCRKAVKQEWKL